jgi:hypothetical protein
MSDFSGLEQSFTLSAMPPLADPLPPVHAPAAPARARTCDVPLHEIEFRALRAADEIGAIQRLRGEIQLPGAAKADPGFIAREKKETGRGWSALSNGMTLSSAR